MFNVLNMSLCFSDLVAASVSSIRIYCFNGAHFETKFDPRDLCKVRYQPERKFVHFCICNWCYL